jgi:hypothetical protein
MYTAVHCVPLGKWTTDGPSFPKIPYTRFVFDLEDLAGIEYNVVDRSIFSDDLYDSIESNLIEGSLLPEVHEIGEGHTICAKVEDGIRKGIDIVTPSIFPYNVTESESDLTQCRKIEAFDGQMRNESTVIACINSDSSSNFVDCISYSDSTSTSVEKRGKKKEEEEENVGSEILLEKDSCSISDLASVDSIGDSDSSSISVDVELKRKNSKKKKKNVNVDSVCSLEKDWKIITYVPLPDVDSFVIALTIADPISHFCSSAELSKERRIKINSRRLLKECEAFVKKYDLPTAIDSNFAEDTKVRFTSAGKLLVLLNHDLSLVGEGGGAGGPINVIPSGQTVKLSDLTVVVKHPNNMWYPASRRLIKFLFNDIVDKKVL